MRFEEQLSRVFVGAAGPMIAATWPADRLPRLGAIRVDLSQDRWQQEVADLLERAQAVVMQFDRGSQGVAWELERILSTAAPERILFVFHNKKHCSGTWVGGGPFRRFLEIASPLLSEKCELPDSMGDATFLVFDSNWQPELLELKFRAKLFRGYFASDIKLKKSLQPFLDRLDGATCLAN